MKPARLLVAAAVGISYPSLVGAVAAGILTFTAARVFAESAPPLGRCGASAEACTVENGECSTCRVPPCKCERRNCFDRDAGGIRDQLLCERVFSSCDDELVAECTGKTEGAACGAGGTCVAGLCQALADGLFTPKKMLRCEVSASATDAAVEAPSEPEDAGAPPVASGGDDSGCATTPGSTASPALAAITLGAMLLWRLRRRSAQPTNAPSSRKRS